MKHFLNDNGIPISTRKILNIPTLQNLDNPKKRRKYESTKRNLKEKGVNISDKRKDAVKPHLIFSVCTLFFIVFFIFT